MREFKKKLKRLLAVVKEDRDRVFIRIKEIKRRSDSDLGDTAYIFLEARRCIEQAWQDFKVNDFNRVEPNIKQAHVYLKTVDDLLKQIEKNQK